MKKRNWKGKLITVVSISALVSASLASVGFAQGFTLKLGDSGQQVYEAEKLLNKIGYYVEVDNNFDTYTERAVKKFQTKLGISATGVLDQATYDRLKQEVATHDATIGKPVQPQSSPTVVAQPQSSPTVVAQPQPSTVVAQSQPRTVVAQSQPFTVVVQPQPRSTVVAQPQPRTVVAQSQPRTVVAQSQPFTVVVQPQPRSTVVVQPQPRSTVVVQPQPTPTVVVQPQPQPQVTPAPAASANVSLSAQERRMIDLINQERAKQGLQPLQPNAKLMELARLKAKEMVDLNYFSHTSPTYGTPFQMMRAAGVNYIRAAENIAGNRSVDAAHVALMQSSGHRANILNANFNQVGIGIAPGGPYGMMFVQMFTQQ